MPENKLKQLSITQMPDFLFGNEQNAEAATGCTVIICPNGAVTGVDVRGGSPGTRDTDSLNPINNRNAVHAVVLAGGSSFGLESCEGVMQYLEQKNIGRDVERTVVPNVCGAILFDLKCGDCRVRPDKAMGFQACEHAFAEEAFQNGNYGAGTGATVGKSAGLSYAMKGGLGSCLFQYDDLLVGAVAAVNCVGDVTDTRTGETLAGAFRDHQFLSSADYMLKHYTDEKDFFSSNTVIGTLVTNASLNKNQATKLAGIGQDSIARAISPAHSIFDGDTVFAMSCGDVYANLDAVGILASKAMEAAIANSIVTAKSAYGYRSYREIQKNIK